MRYLITGASGMLGRDLQAGARRARRDGARPRRPRRDGCRGGRRRGRRTRRRPQLRRLHEGRRRRGARGRRVRRERDRRRRTSPRRPPRAGAKLVHDLDRLRLRRQRHDAVRGGSPRATPISAYGRTKAAGEELALERAPRAAPTSCAPRGCTARTGRTSRRPCSPSRRSKDTWSVVDDQVGQPTWTADLARQIVDAARRRRARRHLPRHELRAGELVRVRAARCSRRRASTPSASRRPTARAFVRPAPRPAYSVLGHDAWAAVGLEPDAGLARGAGRCRGIRRVRPGRVVASVRGRAEPISTHRHRQGAGAGLRACASRARPACGAPSAPAASRGPNRGSAGRGSSTRSGTAAPTG